MCCLNNASIERLLKPEGEASKKAKFKHDILRVVARTNQGQIGDSAMDFEWGLAESRFSSQNNLELEP